MNSFLIILMLALMLTTSVFADKPVGPVDWDLNKLYRTPKTYASDEVEVKGKNAVAYERILTTPELRAKDTGNVRAIYYDGLTYKGKPTRVFAFIGVPNVPPGTKVPAIVLVHGGGGSASEAWVRRWNACGYAAIAMDTCGCIPIGVDPHWKRSEWGGPAGWGDFDKSDLPIEDHWEYHAVADIILAHSILRSLPEVDKDRIGITGISWGGYLTCIASSVDKRFKFAVPIYGCGFLGESSAWSPVFHQLGEAKAQLWLSRYDPSVYLGSSDIPMLWVTSPTDFAYHLGPLQKSYRLPKGPRTLAIRVGMVHSANGPGETPGEIRAFVDSICKGGQSLPRIVEQGKRTDRLWAKYESQTPITKAEICFTKDSCTWPERKWEVLPARLVKTGFVSAGIPDGATACYLNIMDSSGLLVSTEHLEIR